MLVLEVLDILGVFVFACSGALLAHRKQMDVFGLVVLAFLPAVGGGTFRDLLLDQPVFWIERTTPLIVVLSAAAFSWITRHRIQSASKALAWFDAVGLAVFAVLGAEKTLAITGDPIIAVVMGVVSAVVGGILRDVVANDVPLVLKGEVYATAALAGATVYVLMFLAGVQGAVFVGITTALAIRAAGILGRLALPRA